MTGEVYDVLIVGAGSAGCALAARISEQPNLRVALIEAGPDYPHLADTPYDLINSHNNSYRDHDWGFEYQPTESRRDRFPRGRVTGGSSAVNTTIALRGMPEDYDEWADLGNPGWAWQDVLPAFRRLERDLDFGTAPYHGDSGPIPIRRYPPDELLPQHQAFLASAEALDYPYCADANDPNGWGAGPQPMNKLGRLRISAAVGYLAPARLRPNLDIIADTTAVRLVFEKKRCTGVEVLDKHGSGGMLEGKLTIVATGAIQTPGLLLRSGLGPARELGALGVDTVADLPGVGKNLCDHPAVSVVCRVKDASLVDQDAPLIQTILRYTAEGSPYRNDLQIEQISFAGRPQGEPLFAIAAVLEYQLGRGEIVTSSVKVDAAPAIHNRFCEDDRDASRLASCLQDTLRFATAGPLAQMIDVVTFPDPKRGHELEDLTQVCRKFSGSGYHPSGTAKMGPRQDPTAVVDAGGRCHGVERLVVADASIMPHVPRANTNLTCLMIGEHIGEMIRTAPQDYGV